MTFSTCCKVEEIVKADSIEYPSMKNFVDKAIRRQLDVLQKRQLREDEKK
jgi:hypothetical protein